MWDETEVLVKETNVDKHLILETLRIGCDPGVVITESSPVRSTKLFLGLNTSFPS